MRITGGELCGRTIAVPMSDSIRPTQDRVREAFFSMIQCEIPGAKFLDLFAGTGAVGLEAISRGASGVTFVEMNAKHLEILRKNIEAFRKLPLAELVRSDAYRYVDCYAGTGFDIVFADPPYALGEERGYVGVLKTLAERGVVKPGGLFAAEMTSVQNVGDVPGWDMLRDRTYGKTRICLWRRIVGEHLP